MITSLQERKKEKLLEAARMALAAEACKPVRQMDTVFMQKCIELISQNSVKTTPTSKRQTLWEAFMAFLCGE